LIASFSLHFSSGKRPGDVEVIAYDKNAQNAQKFLNKGDQILIMGLLNQYKVNGAGDGLQVIANEIKLITRSSTAPTPAKLEQETPFDMPEAVPGDLSESTEDFPF
jgi:single-stranded DNA-binding protein